jgi:uncharacterized RDD family membrane protein YckC
MSPAPEPPARPAPARAGSAPARDGGPVEAPAGFWRRAAAWSIDLLLLSPLLLLVLAAPWQRVGNALLGTHVALQDWLLGRLLAPTPPTLLGLAREVLAEPLLRAPVEVLQGALGAALLATALRGGAIAALYFVGFECGPWAATPGKRLLGLRVAGLDGRGADWPRVLLRFLAGSLSWLTLNIGHALAGWRVDRRALHDLVAGTQVLGRGPMPGWARAFLVGIVALTLLAPLAVFAWTLWTMATL